jgi:hypothetical protein
MNPAPQEHPKNQVLFRLSSTVKFIDGSKSGTYVPQERPFNVADPNRVRNIDT